MGIIYVYIYITYIRGGREGDRKKRERYREETSVYEKGAKRDKRIGWKREGVKMFFSKRLSHVSIDRLRNEN